MQEHERDVEGVAQREERDGLVAAVGVAGPALVHRLVRHEAHHVAAHAGERGDQAPAEALLDGEDLAAVGEPPQHPGHVVGAVARLRHQVRDRRHLGAGAGRHLRGRRSLAAVRGQVGEEAAHEREAGVLGRGRGVREAGLLGVHLHAAQLLGGDPLAGRQLQHAGTGHRHRGALEHHHEIGEARVPGRQPVGLPEHRGHHRHPAAARAVVGGVAEGGDAGRAHDVGHAGPARLGQVHDGQPAPRGEALQLRFLVRGDAAGRRGHHREVIGAHHDRPAVDATEAADLGIGRGVVLHARHVGGVEGADLQERARVQQALHPLAGVQRARRPSPREALGSAHAPGLRAPGVEVAHPLVPGHGARHCSSPSPFRGRLGTLRERDSILAPSEGRPR